MKTFYVAASSADLPRARAFMRDLEALGFTNELDWTTSVEPLAPVSDWPRLAEVDLDAAVNASIFVQVADKPSLGAMTELGARLWNNSVCHVVVGDHLFHYHPLVVRHASWDAFLRAVE